jgi:hypothetical protein
VTTLREIRAREAREDAAYWLDRTRCAVCGQAAEVWLPDGEGDQVPFCGLHEPEPNIGEPCENYEEA